MTKQELQYIQATFQLHALIADGNGNSEEADAIRDRMETFNDVERDENLVQQQNLISSYCYALTESDGKLKEQYRELLFTDTVEQNELDAIWFRSA